MARCNMQQFGLFVWKNYLDQKRNLFWSIIEMCIPVVVPLLLVAVVRPLAPIYKHTNSTTWDEFQIDDLPLMLNAPECGGPGNKFRLAFVPDTDATYRVAYDVIQRLGRKLHPQPIGFETEEELEQYMNEEDSCSRAQILAAIVVTSQFHMSELEPEVTYKLRLLSEKRIGGINVTSIVEWNTDASFLGFDTTGPRSPNSKKGGLPGYYRQGFLALQHAVDLAIINEHNSTAMSQLDDISIRLKRHPYPPYTEDVFIQLLGSQLPLLIMFNMFLVLPSLTKNICLEKERKQKEFMSLCGSSTLMAAGAMFLRYFTLYIIGAALVTLFIYLPTPKGGLVNYTAPSVFFVLVVMYCMACIILQFAVSTFCGTAVSGGAATGIIHLLTYMPFFYMQFRLAHMSAAIKAGTSVFPNLALAYAFHNIALMEGKGVGVQWSNLHIPPIPEVNYSVMHSFLFFILDMVIYSIIAWYFDAVLPREHGTPKHWYFPLSKQFWCRSSYKRNNGGLRNINYQSDKFEPFESGLRAGMQIRDLKKVYEKGAQPVVSDFSLDMLEGHITVLIGQNGCGKTSVISILTGFESPSSGTIYINGYHTTTNMINARSSLGFCPQQDILFDALTVKEHLTFYAKLKGKSKGVHDETEYYIKALHMEHKRDTKATDLLVVYRRKLSIAMALIAGSKCVVLDAPTTSMDPVTQRQVWELLRKEKKNRTILLTTQSMDEADAVADRVAIMAEGRVHCCGSPRFLKHTLCNCYSLSILKEPDCDVEKLIKTVKSQMPTASIEHDIGRELHINLPQHATDQILGLLNHVEEHKASLGVASLKAATPNLEDVVNKITRIADEPLDSGSRSHRNVTQTTRSLSSVSVYMVDTRSNTTLVKPTSGFPADNEEKSCQQHVTVMLSRNITISGRNIGSVLMHMFLVVIFVVGACGIAYSPLKLKVSPPYDLTLDNFRQPIAPYQLQNGTGPSIIDELGEKYQKVLQGVNTPLVDNNVDMEDYLTDEAGYDVEQYIYSHMTAATFTDANGPFNARTTITGHFNNEAYHTAAISLSIITNTMAKYVLGDDYSIRVTNHPLPRDKNINLESVVNPNSVESLIISFSTLFGFIFLTSSFTTFIIKDRTTKSKHMQLLTGVNPGSYWLSAFIWDYTVLLICGGLTIIIFVAFQLDGYSTWEGVGVLVVAFLLYGWATIPLNYLLAFLFDVPGSASVWITAFHNMTSTAVLIAVSILKSPMLDQQEATDVVEWVFMSILPHYTLQNILLDLPTNDHNRELCTAFVSAINMSRAEMCEKEPNSTSRCCPESCGMRCAPYQSSAFGFHFPGAGRCLVLLAALGCLFFVILFTIESNMAYKMKQKRGKKEEKSDDDIKKMETRADDVMQTDKLTKQYGPVEAVRGLSINIGNGEAIGLLGVNGSGKSTFIKVLTGDETVTNGEAVLCGVKITKHNKRNLGYCPQHDDQAEQMTVRELLRMYASLRGVKDKDIPRDINVMLEEMNLTQHANKQGKYLSGGDRRKLSVAIALVGCPSLVFLDEPTRSMDPDAKRLLWQSITNTVSTNSTAMCTSLSIDECQMFSTRLVTLINGSLKMNEPIADVNTIYCDGYTLVAKIQPPDMTSEDTMIDIMETKVKTLKNYIKETILGAVLKGEHLPTGLIIYKIKKATTTLADIFESMEKSKQNCDVLDYAISDLSLEQIFLKGFVIPGKNREMKQERSADKNDEQNVKHKTDVKTDKIVMKDEIDSSKNTPESTAVKQDKNSVQYENLRKLDHGKSNSEGDSLNVSSPSDTVYETIQRNSSLDQGDVGTDSDLETYL